MISILNLINQLAEAALEKKQTAYLHKVYVISHHQKSYIPTPTPMALAPLFITH
jgi:hypothetical protein